MIVSSDNRQPAVAVIGLPIRRGEHENPKGVLVVVSQRTKVRTTA